MTTSTTGMSVQAMGKKKKKSWAKRRKTVNRKAWEATDPCMRCEYPGPHWVQFSHEIAGEPVFIARCGKCNTYQKFLSESQAEGHVSAPIPAVVDDSADV